MIPGLGSGLKSLMNMPVPNFVEKVDKRKKTTTYSCNTDLPAQTTQDIWVHKIEVIGSNEIEKEIEKILTQMKIEYA